jgi:23S rRNA pseudouridine2605 synthase
MERVQKVISNTGFCSRRKAEDLIRAGKVKVNGKVIKLGAEADRYWDKIVINGEPLPNVLEEKKYLLLYKPVGYVCSRDDPIVKKNIYDLVPEGKKLFSVGRLDVMSEGLIILTNDGDFANKVMHPRYEVEKEYCVMVDKPFKGIDKNKIEVGIKIDDKDGNYLVKGIKIDIDEEDPKTVFLTLHEGKKRVIRRIMKTLNYGVLKLIRIKIGRLSIGGLKVGAHRNLSKKEIDLLLSNKRFMDKRK